MKILITGAKGFIGKNLIATLLNSGYTQLSEVDKDTPIELLGEYCRDCGFVFHLAGVNRPTDESEFMKNNFEFTGMLLGMLQKHNNTAPVLLASSIQAGLNNPYGLSKKAAEDMLLDHVKQTDSKAFIYRYPNIFGKWCLPNYNSVIATFCHNIANGLPIDIHNHDTMLSLAYIDDVIAEMLRVLQIDDRHTGSEHRFLPVIYRRTLGEVAQLLLDFKNSRDNLYLPDLADDFTKKLYSTYLSYLTPDSLSYKLASHSDIRGSFAELLKSVGSGQISINTVNKGATKGNHWHHTKTEKFVVVSGRAVIRLRQVHSSEISSYYVSGEQLEVIDIPPGYTHNISNIGDTELVFLIWANEVFDKKAPETYFLEV